MAHRATICASRRANLVAGAYRETLLLKSAIEGPAIQSHCRERQVLPGPNDRCDWDWTYNQYERATSTKGRHAHLA